MLARILLLSSLSLPTMAQSQDPAAFVAAIYRPYLAQQSGSGPLGSESSIRATFSPMLAALLIRDRKMAVRRGEIGCIDADPFVEGQDYQITRLRACLR